MCVCVCVCVEGEGILITRGLLSLKTGTSPVKSKKGISAQHLCTTDGSCLIRWPIREKNGQLLFCSQKRTYANDCLYEYVMNHNRQTHKSLPHKFNKGHARAHSDKYRQHNSNSTSIDLGQKSLRQLVCTP